MVGVEEIDDDLEFEVTNECEKYGNVEKVVLYQEKQSADEGADFIVKVFVVFGSAQGELNCHSNSFVVNAYFFVFFRSRESYQGFGWALVWWESVGCSNVRSIEVQC